MILLQIQSFAGVPSGNETFQTRDTRRNNKLGHKLFVFAAQIAEFAEKPAHGDHEQPDFREEELYGAILYYQQRERRFGKTSEQLIL